MDWRRRRLDGFGDPGRALEGLADGGGDDVELSLDGLGEGLGVGGEVVGVLFHVHGHGGELGVRR